MLPHTLCDCSAHADDVRGQRLPPPKHSVVAKGVRDVAVRDPSRQHSQRKFRVKHTLAKSDSLRSEVITLQKENRDLRKEFDDLKKKIDALTAEPGHAKSAKPANPAKAKR
jgi:hypothetical protein